MNGQQGQLSLSFVPPADVTTYVRSFQNSVGPGGARIGGDSARRVLMQSRLPVSELGRIWELSDIHKQGSLSLAEFALAMFLAQSRIKGKQLPDSLPDAIKAEVDAANRRATHVPLATTPALSAPQTNPMQAVPMSQAIPMTQQIMPMSQASSMTQQVMPASQPNIMSMPMQRAALPPPAAVSPPASVGTGAAESVHEFESRFPDIAPTAGASASAALSSIKQSFGRDVLGARAAESQHQWAITGTERAQYEAIFRKWDPGRRGVLRGEQAREVFAQSGLPQSELAAIWALSDINNQGELNLNEFSVAMHLIFRRLAGAPIPDRLPAELVPRSSKDFMDSLNVMKEQLMFKDIVAKQPPSRAATPAAVPSTRAGSSYATDNDDDMDDGATYRSANRRRNRHRDHSQQQPSSGRGSAEPSRDRESTGESLDQLRARVRERREQVQRLRDDAEREGKQRAEGRVTARWRVDSLKREIEELHRATPEPAAGAAQGGENDAERARFVAKRDKLVASISDLVQVVPGLAAEYEKLSGELAAANKQAVQLRAQKSDQPEKSDMESRAARLVAQRMAALTGESLDDIDAGDGQKSELERIEKQHRERIDRMQSVTSGLSRVQNVLRDLGLADKAAAPGARKWEDGVGIDNKEVRDLVLRLQSVPRRAAAAVARPAATEASKAAAVSSATSSTVAASKPAAPSIAQRLAAATNQADRERILQEIASERFRERERALSVSEPVEEPPAKPAEPVRPAEPIKPAEPAISPSFESRFPSAFNPEPPANGDEGTPFKSPITPDPKPEMRQRVEHEREPSANNPFGTAMDKPEPVEPSGGESDYNAIFNQSLEVPDSSDSSSDEWDRDDSSDDDDVDLLGLGSKPAKPAASAHAGDLSSESSVSFNTAFANPSAAEPKPSDTLEALAKEETNPFLGLLAAAASVANDDVSDGPREQSVPTTDLISTVSSEPAPAADFKQLRVRALYPYTADTAADELAIATGDLLETRPIPSTAPSAGAHAGDGWMFGEILEHSDADSGDGWKPSGKQGWFPSEYAEVLGEPGSRGWNKTRARFGSAKYDYDPQHDDELKVREKDRVRVIDGDIAESWWKVRKLHVNDGERSEGMLPAMYIDLDKSS